jgi:hypothetical protein
MGANVFIILILAIALRILADRREQVNNA